MIFRVRTQGELRVQVSYIDLLLEWLPNTPLMVAGHMGARCSTRGSRYKHGNHEADDYLYDYQDLSCKKELALDYSGQTALDTHDQHGIMASL